MGIVYLAYDLMTLLHYSFVFSDAFQESVFIRQADSPGNVAQLAPSICQNLMRLEKA